MTKLEKSMTIFQLYENALAKKLGIDSLLEKYPDGAVLPSRTVNTTIRAVYQLSRGRSWKEREGITAETIAWLHRRDQESEVSDILAMEAFISRNKFIVEAQAINFTEAVAQTQEELFENLTLYQKRLSPEALYESFFVQ